MVIGGERAHTAGMTPPADAPPEAVSLGCPRCGRQVIDPERCASCGLPLTGPAIERLRVVVGRLVAIGHQQRALGAEAAALRQEQAELLRTAGGQTFTARAPRAPESRPEMVRDVLLWL